MPKTLAYMIAWTTYATWLQGDERCYVTKGKIRTPDKAIADSNRSRLSKQPVKLSPSHQHIVANTIIQTAEKLNQQIHAFSVSSTHVHILAEYIHKPIGRVVSHYKNSAHAALRTTGFTGRFWTRGFDKRYCFDKNAIDNRIAYINAHNKNHKMDI